MKLLALADLHSEEILLKNLENHLKENKYDLITLSGDITNFGPISYLEELLTILKNQKVFAVLGNCDPLEIKKILGEICVENKNKILDKYNISGIGGAIGFKHPTIKEPGRKTEEEFDKELLKLEINNNTIFLSHSPPYGILDKTFNNSHIGSKSIKEMIEKKQPLLFICGHVHEECGIKKIGKTNVINLPPANELKGGVITIDSQNKLDVKFINL